MKKIWSDIKKIAGFLALTAIGLFFWLLFFRWLTVDILKYSPGTLETAISATAVLGAGFIAYRELSEVAKSRYIDVADRLFEELNSPENTEARKAIYYNLKAAPDISKVKLSAETRKAMRRVLNSLDRVAFLTQEGWIPEDLVMPWMHPMIVKSWEKLEPYVLYQRERRNEPYYFEQAEELAERCDKWRKNNLPEDIYKTKWVGDAL
jgi:hypothetical protein